MLWHFLAELDRLMQLFFTCLEVYPTFKVILFILLGMVIGSYAGMMSIRLPLRIEAESLGINTTNDLMQKKEEANQNASHLLLSKKRSHCPNCLHTISFYHNIPIVSYLWLKGRCAYCQQLISSQYLLIEIQMVMLFLSLALLPVVNYTVLSMLVVTYFVVVLFWTDKTHYLLPDALTLSLLWFGLFCNLFELFVPLSDAVIGAMVGYGSLWCINAIFKSVRGYEGMGQGDMKYFAAIGACIGTADLLMILTLSAGLAILHVLQLSVVNQVKQLLIIKKCRQSGQQDLTGVNVRTDKISKTISAQTISTQPIAFGSYLSISFWIVCYYRYFWL